MPISSSDTFMLRCLDIDGSTRYELPATLRSETKDYFVYVRHNPSVIHYLKNKIFHLENREIVLVSKREHHCISVSFDKHGHAVNMYVNINLPPTAHETGHEWRDLELDIKLCRDHGMGWTPRVVDMDEFEKSGLSVEHRELCVKEIETMLHRIVRQEFPFHESNKAWFQCAEEEDDI